MKASVVVPVAFACAVVGFIVLFLLLALCSKQREKRNKARSQHSKVAGSGTSTFSHHPCGDVERGGGGMLIMANAGAVLAATDSVCNGGGDGPGIDSCSGAGGGYGGCDSGYSGGVGGGCGGGGGSGGDGGWSSGGGDAGAGVSGGNSSGCGGGSGGGWNSGGGGGGGGGGGWSSGGGDSGGGGGWSSSGGFDREAAVVVTVVAVEVGVGVSDIFSSFPPLLCASAVSHM
uniref:Uncharacterized protein n=1 Tax=Nelumbo nucifera TaxID=4432 RepID=A0A822YB78_NELNU|nr:TPA_asm: hypothetical protein HUJ06_029784 [Nelumbo nucifera]